MMEDVFDIFEGLFDEQPQNPETPKAVPKKATRQTKAKKDKTETAAAERPKAEKKPKKDSMQIAIEKYFEQVCLTDPEFAAKYRSGQKTAKDACVWLKEYHKKDAVNGCCATDDDADNLLAMKFIMDDSKQVKSKTSSSPKPVSATKPSKMTAETLPDEEEEADETSCESETKDDDVIDIFADLNL